MDSQRRLYYVVKKKTEMHSAFQAILTSPSEITNERTPVILKLRTKCDPSILATALLLFPSSEFSQRHRASWPLRKRC
jgi:hypothetical protein